MPSTANGFRYPASSDAPNVPQAIQNLASDVDGAEFRSSRLWVIAHRGGATTYNYQLGNSFTTLPNLTQTITVAAGRQFEVDVSFPSVELSTGGAVTVRLLIDNVEVDAAILLASAAHSGSMYLTGTRASTAAGSCSFQVQALKTGSGTYTIGGVSGSGPRLRYRML